jgi:hypothetical protein
MSHEQSMRDSVAVSSTVGEFLTQLARRLGGWKALEQIHHYPSGSTVERWRNGKSTRARGRDLATLILRLREAGHSPPADVLPSETWRRLAARYGVTPAGDPAPAPQPSAGPLDLLQLAQWERSVSSLKQLWITLPKRLSLVLTTDEAVKAAFVEAMLHNIGRGVCYVYLIKDSELGKAVRELDAVLRALMAAATTSGPRLSPSRIVERVRYLPLEMAAVNDLVPDIDLLIANPHEVDRAGYNHGTPMGMGLRYAERADGAFPETTPVIRRCVDRVKATDQWHESMDLPGRPLWNQSALIRHVRTMLEKNPYAAVSARWTAGNHAYSSACVGSYHFHIDVAGQLWTMMDLVSHLSELAGVGEVSWKASKIVAARRGPQSTHEGFRETFRHHDPDPEGPVSYFITCDLPGLDEQMSPAKIRAAVDRCVTAARRRFASSLKNAVLEVEQVVGTARGKNGGFAWLPSTTLGTKHDRFEIHHGFSIPKQSAAEEAPIDLSVVELALLDTGIEVGGLFVFDDGARWIYRTNSFCRGSAAVRSQAEREYAALTRAFAERLDTLPHGRSIERLKTTVERLVQICSLARNADEGPPKPILAA